MVDSCGGTDSSLGSSFGDHLRPSDFSRQKIDYIFIKLLGRGAFGDANLYRKVESNELVVWKEVDLRKMSEKATRNALNEVKILAILDHPNIISYLNHFSDSSTLYIEMEYANGGTLYDKVNGSSSPLGEETILWYSYQLVLAVEYVHARNILHRDIKTLNIFLTKLDHLKLGDFGISKVLESGCQSADSVVCSFVAVGCVGTPYYMSPEVIRGESYDQKSDMWSIGCALYELMTSSRAFEATNPLKLVSNIIDCHVPSISGAYSVDLVELLSRLLSKEKGRRPSASEMRDLPLFDGAARSWKGKLLVGSSTDNRGATRDRSAIADRAPVVSLVTSKSSELFCWGGGKFVPQKMEMFNKERKPLQVSVGHWHSALVTIEKELYTWSNAVGRSGTRGQLGHGDGAAYKAPKKVEFEGVAAVELACCGEDFTVCLTDDGRLYFFGSNEFGCSGLEGEIDDLIPSPTQITPLADHRVDTVSCGSRHVIALVRPGDVYTWGSGEYGCLGHGDEENRSTPHKVSFLCMPRLEVSRVHAGLDRSIALTGGGLVLACGSNEYNKLGFNHSLAGVSLKNLEKEKMTCEVQQSMTFELVRALKKYHVVDASSGLHHTVFLDWLGRIVTTGNNRYGQLGVGDLKPRQGINLVGGALAGQKVSKVACGDWFTVVATEENVVHSWGLGESGRLGNAVPEFLHPKHVSSSSHQKMVTSFPRPVFGSLHEVSDLSCRHWNAAIIAEKVLTQKTVASFSLPSSTDPLKNDSQSLNRSPPPSSSSPSFTVEATQGTVPDWLKAEMEFAEKLEDLACCDAVPDGSADNVASIGPEIPIGGGGLGISSDEADPVCRDVEELKNENRDLKRRIEEQAEEIKSLREALEVLKLHNCPR